MNETKFCCLPKKCNWSSFPCQEEIHTKAKQFFYDLSSGAVVSIVHNKDNKHIEVVRRQWQLSFINIDQARTHVRWFWPPAFHFMPRVSNTLPSEPPHTIMRLSIGRENQSIQPLCFDLERKKKTVAVGGGGGCLCTHSRESQGGGLFLVQRRWRWSVRKPHQRMIGFKRWHSQPDINLSDPLFLPDTSTFGGWWWWWSVLDCSGLFVSTVHFGHRPSLLWVGEYVDFQ